MSEAVRRDLPTRAHFGGPRALTTTPILGSPTRSRPDVFVPGTEHLGEAEIRVTVLGSGYPFIPGLLGSLPKVGRMDSVEIWGGGCDDPELGLASRAFRGAPPAALTWPAHRSVAFP